MFHAVVALVIVLHLNNDQTMTKFHARFRPNFTGRASDRASQARAWAVSKVWAYMFSVVERYKDFSGFGADFAFTWGI